MKVLFVNLVYGVGSTGKIIADIMDLLRNHGHKVKVLYGSGPNINNDDAIKISTKPEYYFHNALSRFTDHTGLYSAAATRRLIREVQAFAPDLIHLHTLHGYYVNYEKLFHYLKRADIPIVWTQHDCWSFTGHCTHYSQIGCTQWKTLCKDCRLLHQYPQCYLHGDVRHNYLRKKEAFTGVKNLIITTPSQWLANQVSQSFLQNYPTLVVPNGIDRNVFHKRPSQLKSKYHLLNKNIVLGVANVWNTHKGLQDLLSLSNRLGAAYQVVLIGLSEKQLYKMPSNILGLQRTTDQTELAQWYTIADVFVNPTYEDTFPTVNLEAQACGTPVIVYQTGGCPETLVTNDSVLIPQGDLTAMERAVRRIVMDNVRVDSNITECLDKDRAYAKYIQLYQQISESIQAEHTAH